eukprot:5772805-Ditylum_brightwellii.AAC.1
MRDKKKKLHLHLRKEYFLGFPGTLQHLRQQKLSCSSLVQPYLSPWQKRFEDVYYTHTALGRYDYPIQKINNTAGWQRLLDAKDCLGLVLEWTRTCGAMWILGLIFGVTSLPLDRYLKFGRQLMLHILEAEENI